MIPLIRNIILSVAGICVISYVIFSFFNEEKKQIAYVDNMRLFNEFLLKKELENELSKKEVVWKSRLDSMRIQLNMLSAKAEKGKVDPRLAEEFEFTRQQYLMKEEQFKLDNGNTADRFNDQIWKQLNNYVKEFAQSNNYDMVLGTSGEGNLMYASEQYDITEAAIAFVNQKYKGEN